MNTVVRGLVVSIAAVGLLSQPGLAGTPGVSARSIPAGQVSFEQSMRDLASADPGMRLRTVQMLKDAAYVEAAVPLAKLLMDPEDQVQLEAIAAELNIFLSEKVVTRKRVGFVVEKRTPIVAQVAFESGPLAVGPRLVPPEVLTALRMAARDDNPRVGLEALYAFGVLAVAPGGAARLTMLKTAGPDLAAMVGAVDPVYRYAAVRVIGQTFAARPGDEPIAPGVGDAVIGALNDKDTAVRLAATESLGSMRYERAVQGLVDLFQYYGKGDMAAASLDAIARIGHGSSQPLLLAQLASKDPTLKGIAIEGLARAGERARWASVQGALAGERNEAVQLAGRFAAVRLADGSVDPIVDALAKPKLHDQARNYLTALADGGATLFVRRLQDPSARVRAEIVDALGLSYDPSVIPLLTPLASDPDADVARAVERALAHLNQPR